MPIGGYFALRLLVRLQAKRWSTTAGTEYEDMARIAAAVVGRRRKLR